MHANMMSRWAANYLHVQVTKVLMKRRDVQLEEVLECAKVADEGGLR
jgi:hypothetical protein